MASVAQAYDAALLDLDGTIYEGGAAIPNALEGLTEAGLPMVFITNNASRAPQTVADQLNSLGYDVKAEDVMTSAQAAIEMAADIIEPGSNVYVLGAEAFKDLAREAGYTVVDSADDEPAAVFHGLNREMTWKQMSEAALSISRGARYLASNLDTTLPSERGFQVGNGAIAAAITTTTGVEPLSAGKPKPPMFIKAAERIGSNKPLAIGDRLDTDIAGGNAAEIDTFMVVTGVSTHMDVVTAAPEFRPSLIGADMRALNREIDAARPGPQAGFSARYDDTDSSVIVLSGGNVDDPRLADPKEAAVAALLTVVDVVWNSDAGKQAAVEISQVRTEGPAAAAALAAWRM
ncbi:MAG: HAD-IIA family hydrolase [Corynebacterium sp.]|uniref:HAD-IIA family hydrolase n=1 Tax=Corynebacterium sp. TaxID=1720 RepID=UPI0026DC2DF7|nr:HAD-IIA family hydrolase [Corynebacterium sp.]MDO5028963.1 HAD-IIA family hydrolase [Corynebacterium sp.]